MLTRSWDDPITTPTSHKTNLRNFTENTNQTGVARYECTVQVLGIPLGKGRDPPAMRPGGWVASGGESGTTTVSAVDAVVLGNSDTFV